MKLKLITTYEFVDEKWLAWWLDNNGPKYGVTVRDELPFKMFSKDPTSDVQATTTIELIEDAE